MSWETRIQLIAALILLASFVAITYIKQSKKKPFIFSQGERPPDIFEFDKISVKQDRFNFTLNYELFGIVGEDKKPIGFFEERTKWYTGIINFFYQLYSIIGFSAELKDLSGKALQKYKQGFGVLAPKFRVYDANGNLLGIIRKKIKWGKELWEAGIHLVKILDASDNQIGYIKADTFERRYKVFNQEGQLVCQIDKPFKNLPWSKKEAATMAKESFFFDDKFIMQYHANSEEPMKRFALASMLYVAVNFYERAQN